MKRTTFFDHYRLAKDYDGSPVEIGRRGAAVIYKASDLRSGAPVAVTLLPVESVNPEQRERFEEKARAALSLDHINIVRTVEFGREEDDYAFVSEYPPGETLASWVVENGPMSADAVLRVALQVVSALSAASFHRIHHRGIEPSNIMIVSGQTAEGGWPAVKLMNFSIAGLPAVKEDVADTNPYASPEQLDQGRVDFRSEIYSLGATMCFLLTGAFYTAEPRSLQTKRFAPPLRRLIAPMLRQNPDERPQDPVMVANELHACLQKVERRQAWSRRFGIPFAPVGVRPVRRARMPARQPKSILAAAIERPNEPVTEKAPVRPRHVWLRRTLITAAVLLAAATVAAMLLPAPVSLILHKHRDIDSIGVPVGVAEATPTPVSPNISTSAGANAGPQIANSAPHTSMPATSNPAPPNTLLPSPSNNVAQNSLPLAPNDATGHLTNSAPHMAMPIASAPAPTASAATVASNTSSSSVRGPGGPEAAPSPAVSSNAPLSKSEATGATSPTSVTAQAASPSSASSPTHQVATNESASPPPSPAEGPQSVWERMAGDAGHTRIARTEPTKASPEENGTPQSGDSVNDQSGAAADENESGTIAPKTSSHKTKTASARGATTSKNTAAKHRSSTEAQRDEVQAQNRSDDAPPHPRRRLRGTVHAQFAGRTPDGSIVVRFPNGETAIVPPPPGQYIPGQHRYYRPRHPVIYEPRDVSEAPYQPFLSPGD